MERWENFSSSEQLRVEIALSHWQDYLSDLMYKYPKCPDFSHWHSEAEKCSELQKEILDAWAEKRRSA